MAEAHLLFESVDAGHSTSQQLLEVEMVEPTAAVEQVTDLAAETADELEEGQWDVSVG